MAGAFSRRTLLTNSIDLITYFNVHANKVALPSEIPLAHLALCNVEEKVFHSN